MKELIVNADDFGLTRGVNEGIIRAHRDGILTSATLMATGPAFEHAVELAKANPKLGVGCHLVLTDGTAVSPLEEIPSLADANGRLPETLAKFVTEVSTWGIRTEDIERELRAQIEKIRAAGIDPTHVDTHKHTHVHPRVMSALGRTAQEFGITRVRNPVENLRDSWRTARNEHVSLLKNIAASAAVRSVGSWFQEISRRYGLRSPECFLGLALTGQLGPAALRRLIQSVPDGRTEIMVHPGVCDADLAATGSRLQQQRQDEMEGLLAPEVRCEIEKEGVRLITYRELN
jgi:chitin disaccharide deacetylase